MSKTMKFMLTRVDGNKFKLNARAVKTYSGHGHYVQDIRHCQKYFILEDESKKNEKGSFIY